MKIKGERAGREIEATVEIIDEHDHGMNVRYHGKIAWLSSGGTLSRMNGPNYTTLLRYVETIERSE